ncbi:hypothetical protein HUN59_14890 [Curtobacterium sp. Csp2]|uniref:hypothetical protein n=1 Tax=Curtobacterium sp. Csp2 TaxID=2495430 RepID=UPI00157FE072|nr:hypothetical protein [Curtobacterium sp. Csp2]QKS17325.1 hypothetical protein HUN59_14890 [Curtobacterium sp. Csp2]
MNLLSSRYASALLPLLVSVFGILQAAQAAGTGTLLGWQTITQIVLAIVGTGVIYWLPLVDKRWQGAAKTGAALMFAVLSAVVAVAPDGHFTKANAILVLTAIVKAAATELGVQIRTDATKVIDARETAADQVPVVTAVPVHDTASLLAALTPPAPATSSTPGEPSTFEEAQAQAEAAADEPSDAKHLATS